MNIPEIKIIDEYISTSKKYEEPIYNVVLDWKESDKHKIKRIKNWYTKYGFEKPTDAEKKALKECLKEVNWKSEILFPEIYRCVFEKYSKFKMPKSYYDECLYLKEMAIKEWNRSKPFDTMVRESLLKISEQYISSYFFMIYDSISMYNSMYNDEKDHFDKLLLRILLQYRFWKHQTGKGLVLQKSLDFSISSRLNDEVEKVKKVLEENLEFEPLGLPNYYPDKHDKLREIVKSKMRDNQINNILL